MCEVGIDFDYNRAMKTLSHPAFEPDSPYRRLALCLDALPNRFPPAGDESDLALLAAIFSPEEADLAANLLPEAETPGEIAERLSREPRETAVLLKEMAKKGLIAFGKTAQGRPGFRLMPFVVGIYEAQIDRIDAEMAQRFEAYYQKAFGKALRLKPEFHRVVPVRESVRNNLEVRPYDSVTALIDRAQAWGVSDCICRKQKALIGEPCEHPRDMCLVLSDRIDAFAGSPTYRALTREEALQTLRQAADAGLVHCVSNNQRDVWYICNCCTCSCGILRGMAEMGIAGVVAHSGFTNRVDELLCSGCGLCVEACPFGALSLDGMARVMEIRCAGCGVCVPVCPQGALGLMSRPGIEAPPDNEDAWRIARSREKRG